jgi:hypothetical protein
LRRAENRIDGGDDAVEPVAACPTPGRSSMCE